MLYRVTLLSAQVLVRLCAFQWCVCNLPGFNELLAYSETNKLIYFQLHTRLYSFLFYCLKWGGWFISSFFLLLILEVELFIQPIPLFRCQPNVHVSAGMTITCLCCVIININLEKLHQKFFCLHFSQQKRRNIIASK